MDGIPATGPDVFGHMLNLIADTTVRSVVRVRKRLQPSVLVTALESLLCEEPVLSCRLVHGNDDWMYWEPQEGIDAPEHVHEHWTDVDDPLPFCHTPVPDHEAPQLRMDLIHGPERDHLIIATNHSVLDGKGMKDLTRLTLERIAGPSIPAPPKRFPSRSELPIWQSLPDDWMKGAEGDWPYCRWPSIYDSLGKVEGKVMVRQVSLSAMLQLRQSFPIRVTIHDMLMAALYMALLDLRGGKEGGSISSTVDDRRYMSPPLPSLANISSNYAMPLSYPESYLEAVEMVAWKHNEMKQNYIGLPNLLQFSQARTVSEIERIVRDMKAGCGDREAQYFLSNLGTYEINPQTVESLGLESLFGTYNGSEPPTIGLTVSTFQGLLNINTGYYRGIDQVKLNRFMEVMVRCLTEGGYS